MNKKRESRNRPKEYIVPSLTKVQIGLVKMLVFSTMVLNIHKQKEMYLNPNPIQNYNRILLYKSIIYKINSKLITDLCKM